MQAEEVRIPMERLEKFNLDKKVLHSISAVLKDDSLLVYKLPDSNIAVPLLGPITHENPVNVVHVRDYKCPLKKCNESRVRIHTLLKKQNPICLHTMLAWCASSGEYTASNPENSGPSQTKMDRDLTVENVLDQVQSSFPSMSMDNTDFLSKHSS